MEEFKLENYPSIKLCLIHYYKKSGMEKITQAMRKASSMKLRRTSPTCV